MADEMFYMESLPDEVQATIESRNRAFAALGNTAGGLEAVLDELRRWLPDQTVRVAFLGGSSRLHADIAEVAGEISDHCGLSLDFGDDGAGNFRTWSTEDDDYSAEIRVSFDMNGFFSLVGTDSIAPNIGTAQGKVGGRPHQRSLNLGGFAIQRPASWKGTVLHEFLHALGFHHEHVNRRGPCQDDFRFEDDPGYLPTQNANEEFVPDGAGRRPGIYTYLSGAPNFWPKAKVDHNLKPGSDPMEVTTFDRRSVMLYRFKPFFYRTPDSGCAPDGSGQRLSDGDKDGLARMYPQADDQVSQVYQQKQATAEAIAAALPQGADEAPVVDVALETAGAPASGDANRSVLGGSLAALQSQLSMGGQ